jgi:site-specific recombinase
LERELDLYAALHAAELENEDADWVASLSDEDASAWATLICPSAEDILVALRLLAIRAAATGLSSDIMDVMPHRWEHESPFYELVGEVCRHAEGAAPADEALEGKVVECRTAAEAAHTRLEEVGVSSDLVFQLDLVIAQLDRMAVLLRLKRGLEDGRRFAAMLIRGFAEERGIHGLVRSSVNRLARRIVEHTGRSGEHYIADSRSEWWHMGRGAVGGGAITAFTALFKYALAAMPLAPLWIGIAHSLNYTASFVLMQLLAWPLASKMPSMTAAALAEALEKQDGMHTEVELVAAICRTQTVVTVGNLLGAIPLALLIDLALQSLTGHPYLNEQVAVHGLQSMHILRSLTIPFAALTGCFLWLSSLAAGWTANWMKLHQLPEAVAHSRRLNRLAGTANATRAGQFIEHHFSGIAGYVCLGLLLGLLPFVSAFAGLSIEVRHITLAAASLTYDIRSLLFNGPLPWPDVLGAGLGLVATGILNFTVSFALGLWLAIRARRLDTRGRIALARALWREARQDPARFLWREPAAEIG